MLPALSLLLLLGDGRTFHNLYPPGDASRGIGEVLKWKLSGSAQAWPDWVDDNLVPDFKHACGPGKGSVTFINHATELIRFDGLTVITDPVFSKRVGPASWLGPKRHRGPGATLADIPGIDLVLVSHNHYDHLDLPSLVAIEKSFHPKFIVPLGNRALLSANGIRDVIELDWWQDFTTVSGCRITLVPMQHWSSRSPFDKNKALWGGYILEYSGLKVLFAGDTGYDAQFLEIEKRFGPMDLSILPIGAYEPRWFMKAQHMNPEEAVRAHMDLRSGLSIGDHFGTFQLTDEGIEDPVSELRKSLAAAKVAGTAFLAPKNGQTVCFGKKGK